MNGNWYRYHDKGEFNLQQLQRDKNVDVCPDNDVWRSIQNPTKEWGESWKEIGKARREVSLDFYKDQTKFFDRGDNILEKQESLQKLYIAYSDGKYKIGRSKHPINRIKSMRTGNPNVIILFDVLREQNSGRFENAVHQHLDHTNIHGEWFDLESLESISRLNKLYRINGLTRQYQLLREPKMLLYKGKKFRGPKIVKWDYAEGLGLDATPFFIPS